MVQNNGHRPRRRRGVILSVHGLERLQEAKFNEELQLNSGNRYTLETLSDRTGLSVDTLTKVFGREVGVDKQTLKTCFKAFRLELTPGDHCWPTSETSHPQPESLSTHSDLEPELPEGLVPLDSAFYIERPQIENECRKSIEKSGALIRIKAPRRMGKSSLMVRTLDYATAQNYQTIALSFHMADKSVFQNLDKLLQWFCASIALGLNLPNRLSDYWDDLFGSKVSCKIYFEQHILTAVAKPLVLGLDDVDRLFQYPELADEFFGLLRTWHEESKSREVWKKLRLIVAHSIEVYIPINVNKSPFNVGVPIEVPEFNQEQIQDLANRHGFSWSAQQVAQVMTLIGGHPFLVRQALYQLWYQNLTLEDLLQTFATQVNIYGTHLQQQLWNLQQSPELEAAFRQVVTASTPVELDLIQAFQLESMGLVRLNGNLASVSCDLYSHYFRDRFQTSTDLSTLFES